MIVSYFKDHVYGVLEKAGHAPHGRPACFCSACGDALDGLLEPGPDGDCTVCGGSDAYVEAEGVDWMVCQRHRKKWRPGPLVYEDAPVPETKPTWTLEGRWSDYTEIVACGRMPDLAMKAFSGVCPECGEADWPLQTDGGFWFWCDEHKVRWHQPEEGPWGTFYHRCIPTDPASEDMFRQLALEVDIYHYREIGYAEAVSKCPACRR